jgi:hypothetical protein
MFGCVTSLEEPSGMNLKKVIILASVCLFAGIVSCNHRDNASMEQTLQESFPLGKTKDQIEEILTKKKIEHSYAAKENAFFAIIRNTGGSNWPARENIQLVIYLDDEKRVKDVRVSNAFTGP